MDRWWGDIVFRVWYWGLEYIIGYGYKRLRPWGWLLLWVVVGAIVFSNGRIGDVFGDANPNPPVMQQTQGLAIKNAQDEKPEKRLWVEDYPAFRPIAYSADAFLPLVNLHQETYWTPRDGLVKSVYLPLHILVGWVVTTLAAVSITGLVRHEKE